MEFKSVLEETKSKKKPVFKIVCLSDLWDRAKTVKVKNGKGK